MQLFHEEPEVIPETERESLRQLGQNIALINNKVNTMTGVRRGIVVREAERELKRLETARYSK
jgi:hypothetical protein